MNFPSGEKHKATSSKHNGHSSGKGFHIFTTGTYLTTTTDIFELFLMGLYIVRFYRFNQTSSRNHNHEHDETAHQHLRIHIHNMDPSARRLLILFTLAIAYAIFAAAVCLTTGLLRYSAAHIFVTMAFAGKVWVEYGILNEIVKFSGRVQRASHTFWDEQKQQRELAFITCHELAQEKRAHRSNTTVE